MSMTPHASHKFDKRGARAWVRVQLQDNAPSHATAALIADWKKQRQAAANVVKAIQVYAALSQGDLTPLAECFPGLALSLRQMPYPAPRPVSLTQPLTITRGKRSEVEEMDEMLDGLGLDLLDFGD